MPKADKGFTLVELIIAVLIIGLLFGVAVPQFTGVLADYRLKSDALRLAAEIRKVQQESVYGKAGSFKIRFLKNNGQYRIEERVRILETYELSPGVRMAEVVLGANPLTFTIDGAPAGGGGRIVLENDRGQRYYVYIIGATGRVRASRTAGEDY